MNLEDQIKRVHEICGSWGMYEEGQSSEIKQLLYAAGEAGELAIAIAKNDIEGIKDGIGDTLVCLINAAELNCDEVNDNKPFSHNHPVFSYGVGEICIDIGCMIISAGNFSIEDNSDLEYRVLYRKLSALADQYNLTIEECLQQAINEISKRTGKFVNGVFVKDQK